MDVTPNRAAVSASVSPRCAATGMWKVAASSVIASRSPGVMRVYTLTRRAPATERRSTACRASRVVVTTVALAKVGGAPSSIAPAA